MGAAITVAAGIGSSYTFTEAWLRHDGAFTALGFTYLDWMGVGGLAATLLAATAFQTGWSTATPRSWSVLGRYALFVIGMGLYGILVEPIVLPALRVLGMALSPYAPLPLAKLDWWLLSLGGFDSAHDSVAAGIIVLGVGITLYALVESRIDEVNSAPMPPRPSQEEVRRGLARSAWPSAIFLFLVAMVFEYLLFFRLIPLVLVRLHIVGWPGWLALPFMVGIAIFYARQLYRNLRGQ